jgi:hypothetical protein
MARRITRDDTWSTEPRDALELVARMVTGSSYRVPVEGRASVPGLQAVDIAGAVGMLGRGLRLEQQVVVAVGSRAGDRESARLAATAFRRVQHAVAQLRPCPLDMADGADRWRLRMVTFDAARDLVWPEHRRPFGEAARAAKMRKASYMATYRCACAVLEEALESGRRGFKHRLWGSA